MSGDAGEEEALVFMLTSWCDIKTKKQIALRSRSQTEREPWSPEGNSSLYPPTPAAPDLDSSCSLLLDGGALRESCSVKLPSVRPLTKLLYLTRSLWRCLFYISVVCFNINMKKWNYFDQKIVSISYFFRRADNDLPLSEAKMEVIRRCYSAKKTRSGFPLIMSVIFPLMHLV